ncbi:phenylacetate--CoA ligase family protein [Miniimonas sp. S16]|uniref:phenylacetate--CoA ligase family protein n=1 Tax=Miniimonas sp. S16 TaxID=2171623 RepID=UPI00131F0C87|nr:hypothetical protein [Miniimonas sp. S16]
MTGGARHDLRSSLARWSFQIKHSTVRRRSGRFLDDLMAFEQLDRDEVLKVQTSRAASIASFAATQTQFYRESLSRAGVELTELENPGEWAKIPVIGRSDLKENETRILSTEASRRTAVPQFTGGSTGEPLRIHRDVRVPALAFAWRWYRWWGVEPWDNLARVGRWGFGRLGSLKTTVAWWPSQQLYLDAKYIDSESVGHFLRALRSSEPALLEGYVGGLLALAEHVDKTGASIPGLRAVATTAAPLSPGVRASLEAAFGVPVFDEYRGSEVNWMAAECREQSGLHINADARLIEVLNQEGKPAAPGEVGDVVVTDLMNRAFPVLRYRPGDRAALLEEACPCGIGLPLMSPVQGRVTDLLRLPGGVAVNHGVMGMFSSNIRSVRLFRVHQAADYSVKVSVIQGDEPDARRHIEEAVEGLRKQVKYAVPVEVEYVEELPSANGKLQFLTSDVSDDV